MKALAMLLFLPSLAMATDIELGVGQSVYQIRSDGTWYQIGNPHVINRHSYAFQLGLTGKLFGDTWGADWHADYVSLGHLRSTCDCTTLDSLYDTQSHRMKVPSPYPTAKYVGSGVADGLKFSLAPYFRHGDWKYGVEAGLFPYRPGWDVAVYHWPNAVNENFINGSHSTPRGIQLGYVVGAFVQHDSFTLSWDSYGLPTRFDDRHPPALWNRADTLMLTYNF